MVESRGLPIGIIISGANTHDIKLLAKTLESIKIALSANANLCLDAGYVGAQSLVEGMGYTAHIRPRGEEKKECERNLNFKALR